MHTIKTRVIKKKAFLNNNKKCWKSEIHQQTIKKPRAAQFKDELDIIFDDEMPPEEIQKNQDVLSGIPKSFAMFKRKPYSIQQQKKNLI